MDTGMDKQSSSLSAPIQAQLRERWTSPAGKKLIAEIVGGLKSGDNSWVKLLKTLPGSEGHTSSCDLRGVVLDGVILDGADLSFCDLSYASLRGASLRAARFQGSRLSKADFSRSSLPASDFLQVVADNARFDEANLSTAMMMSGSFNNASFVNANLRGAVLDRADLSGANLSSADLQAADAREIVAARPMVVTSETKNRAALKAEVQKGWILAAIKNSGFISAYDQARKLAVGAQSAFRPKPRRGLKAKSPPTVHATD